MKGAPVPIYVESRRRSSRTLQRDFPDAVVVDVTSKAGKPWIGFSPFYPHGGIPFPMSPGYVAQSVEGVWQGLKVFESVGVDESKFDIASMKGLKRTVRRFGPVRGHAAGVASNELLPYLEARYRIYLPTYRWLIENRLSELVERLRSLAESSDVVLLDYETNCDVENLKKPLSHAGPIRAHLSDCWPTEQQGVKRECERDIEPPRLRRSLG